MTTAKTTVNLNLRQGPGTEFTILALLPPETVCEVLGEQGDWLNVKLAGLEGWVHRSFVLLADQGVTPGFINDQPMGVNPAGLPPLAPNKRIVLGAPASALERQAANAWNKYGGLLQALSDKLRIDPGAAVAVL
ncbi:MAG: SH3 domain-containing protein, partial [Anaerolineales bacterium]